MITVTAKLYKIKYTKPDENGNYYANFKTYDSEIMQGTFYQNPDTLINEYIYFKGNYTGKLNTMGEKIFKFKSYEFKDSTLYFFNQVIKIPSNVLKNILEKYTTEQLKDLLDNDPEILEMKVKGFGPKILKKVKNNWERHKDDLLLYGKLLPYGFSDTLISNIRKHYGNSTLPVLILEENPYDMLNVQGVKFTKIDQYALNNGFKHNYKHRILEGLKYSAKKIMDDYGSTLITYSDLYTYGKNILNRDNYHMHELEFAEAINPDNYEGFICIKDGYVTLEEVYNKEQYIFKTLNEYGHKQGFKNLTKDIDTWILNKENFYNISLSEKQKNIIRKANEQYTIFSLSGYAGSGKTMISKLVMELFSEHGKEIHCCALSGVASNRIGLVSGYDSKTMHSLLGYDGISFSFNESNNLPYDLIVLDESGMVNMDMFYVLLKAINWQRTKLFIIGDPAQLPPVGLGNVFKDIIDYQLVINVEMDKVFRTSSGSEINLVAEQIRQKIYPESFENGATGYYTEFEDETSEIKYDREKIENNILNNIINKSKKIMPQGFSQKTLLKYQVIVPMKTKMLGTINLNNKLQETLNDSKEFLEIKDIKYKIFDKVIHLQNINMDIYNEDMNVIDSLKVYNGQIGIIIDIEKDNENQHVTVKYPYEDMIVKYSYSLLKDNYLGLAYALTAHKIQGNEFENVVCAFTYSHGFMINSNYIYSAYTRAKENLYIIGEKDVIKRGVSTKFNSNRKTIIEMLQKYSDIIIR